MLYHPDKVDQSLPEKTIKDLENKYQTMVKDYKMLQDDMKRFYYDRCDLNMAHLRINNVEMRGFTSNYTNAIKNAWESPFGAHYAPVDRFAFNFEQQLVPTSVISGMIIFLTNSKKESKIIWPMIALGGARLYFYVDFVSAIGFHEVLDGFVPSYTVVERFDLTLWLTIFLAAVFKNFWAVFSVTELEKIEEACLKIEASY